MWEQYYAGDYKTDDAIDETSVTSEVTKELLVAW